MNLRFPGQYWDQETQTHYNFNRDYRPNVGRYVQSDPIGIRGEDNFYRYALLNPIRKLDSMGLVTWTGAYTMGSYDIFGLDHSKQAGLKLSLSLGGFVGHAFLKTECVGGKRGTVNVTFVGLDVEFGIGLLGPLTLEASTLTCEAPMDPNAFAGRFTMGSLGTIVAAVTPMTLGNALCDATGKQISTDLAVASLAGGYTFANGRIEDCCN